MGQTRKADIPKTQSRDKISRPVSNELSSMRVLLPSTQLRMCIIICSQLDILQYKPAIALIDTLLTELKRLDDKMILTEVHLLESRVYRGIGNLAKSKVCPEKKNSLLRPPSREFVLLPGGTYIRPNGS
jgi:hypothetical protein